jgi:hypothetical protein
MKHKRKKKKVRNPTMREHDILERMCKVLTKRVHTLEAKVRKL